MKYLLQTRHGFHSVNAKGVPLLLEVEFKQGKALEVYADGSRNYVDGDEWMEPTDFKSYSSGFGPSRRYIFQWEFQKNAPWLFRLYMVREFLIESFKRPQIKMARITNGFYIPHHNEDKDQIRDKLKRAVKWYWKGLWRAISRIGG